MFRLTIARVALAGAGLAAAGGGITAAAMSSASPVSAAQTSVSAAQTSPSASPSPAGAAAPKHPKGGVKRTLGFRLRHALVEATAKATGQTVRQIRDELRAGKSLDDIAGAKAAAVRAAVEQDVKTRVEKAVDAKKITQAQADRFLARLDAAVQKIMAAHRTPKASATPTA